MLRFRTLLRVNGLKELVKVVAQPVWHDDEEHLALLTIMLVDAPVSDLGSPRFKLVFDTLTADGLALRITSCGVSERGDNTVIALCRQSPSLHSTHQGVPETPDDPVTFTFPDIAKIRLLEAAFHIVGLGLQRLCCLDPVAGRWDALRAGLIEGELLNLRNRGGPGGTLLENRLNLGRRIEVKVLPMYTPE